MANSRGHIVMDYDKVYTYIFDMKKRAELLCAQKDTVELLLKRLESDWSDKIFQAAWNGVLDVSLDVQKVYKGMTGSMRAAAEYYDRYITVYNEIKNRNIGRLGIQEYTIGLRRMYELKGPTTTISDLDEMAKFIRGMDGYIKDTDRTIREIERKHQEIGPYWKSVQYDQLAQILVEVKGKINTQLNILNVLNGRVDKKYKYLRDQVTNNDLRTHL